MPARRKLHRIQKTEKKKGKLRILNYILLLVLIVLGIFIVRSTFTRRYWTGEDKLSIVINTSSGASAIFILEPRAGEITKIVVPENTEVDVAGNLGIWKTKSVWELGRNEGIGGQLLARTMVKTFKFPVHVWADSGGEGLLSGNLIVLIKTVVSPFKTNLSLADKISIALFSFKVNAGGREEINLSETTFLKAVTLEDGIPGYKVTGLPSPRLYSNFSEDRGGDVVRVIIKDGSENPQLAKKVGEITEVLGAKVSSIQKTNGQNFVCRVTSTDIKLQKKISLILGCEILKSPPEGNFDLQIEVGKDFEKVF